MFEYYINKIQISITIDEVYFEVFIEGLSPLSVYFNNVKT